MDLTGGKNVAFFLIYLHFGVKLTKLPLQEKKKASTEIIIMNLTPRQIRTIILNAFPPQCLRYRLV